MSQNDNNANAKDLLYLVSCAVNEDKPSPERCAAMDMDAVLELAKHHMLSAAAAFALEKTMALPASWKDAKATAIRRLILFDSERARVTRALEENGIWYLPLKGCILKDYYPKAAMREMTDNDILCDGSRMEDIRSIMTGLGYECALFGRTNHDVYHKSVVSFEMHSTLFVPLKAPVFSAYYENITERLVRNGGNAFGCRFTDEDFYIHVLCHMYKHYSNAGIGLKALLDIYVIDRKKGQSMDRGYLDRELEKLELKSFEQEVRVLAVKTFSMQPLSDEEQKHLMYFINSNSFGLFSNVLANCLHNDDSKEAKRRYLLGRFFPDEDFLQLYYPTVYRHRILYPFLVLYRPFKGLFTKRKALLMEYHNLKKFKKTNVPHSD